MGIGGQDGQAAVEAAAVATVVALLVAATAAWLVATTRPPGAPPDVIGRVAAPLRGPADPRLLAPPPSLTGLLGLPEGAHARAPIGRALRAVGVGVVVVVRARHAFQQGFSDRMRERFWQVVHDPVGELGPGGWPDPALLTPEGVARYVAKRAAARADALRDYVAMLRTMPADEAVVTAAHDAGRASADLAVDALKAWARRRVAGRVGRGGRTPPPPPSPAPESARAP